jgi:hypothetical protein
LEQLIEGEIFGSVIWPSTHPHRARVRKNDDYWGTYFHSLRQPWSKDNLAVALPTHNTAGSRLGAAVAADTDAASAVTFDLTMSTTVVWEEDLLAVGALLRSSERNSGESSEYEGGESELHLW